MTGLIRLACPYLLSAARKDKPRRVVRPKKTTAFSLTQTVCMVPIDRWEREAVER